MPVIVQKIRMEDIDGFHSAIESVAREKKFILTVEPPELEQMREFAKSNIKHNNAHYVALVNKRVVGWADIVPYPRQTIDHVGRLGMGVLAEHRGKGIGSSLLQSAIEHAWGEGLKRLELEVFTDNQVAMKLYRKFGFVTEGVRKYARLIDGKYQDIAIMAQYRP